MADDDRLADLLSFVSADDRVCPRPMEWQEFYELIGGKRTDDASTSHAVGEPAQPLVLGGWAYASDAEKVARFREHIEWAAEKSTLDDADTFLRRLPIEAWHHSRPPKPRY